MCHREHGHGYLWKDHGIVDPEEAVEKFALEVARKALDLAEGDCGYADLDPVVALYLSLAPSDAARHILDLVDADPEYADSDLVVELDRLSCPSKPVVDMVQPAIGHPRLKVAVVAEVEVFESQSDHLVSPVLVAKVCSWYDLWVLQPVLLN